MRRLRLRDPELQATRPLTGPVSEAERLLPAPPSARPLRRRVVNTLPALSFPSGNSSPCPRGPAGVCDPSISGSVSWGGGGWILRGAEGEGTSVSLSFLPGAVAVTHLGVRCSNTSRDTAMAAPQALEGTGRRGLLPRLTLNPLQDPSSLSPLTRNQAASFTRPPSPWTQERCHLGGQGRTRPGTVASGRTGQAALGPRTHKLVRAVHWSPGKMPA